MAKPKKKYTEPVSLPMLPLRGLMVFPHMVLHFDAGRKKSIAALDQAMEENQRIFLVAQRDMDVDDPAVDDIYHVGTIACVKQVLRLPGGNVRLLVEGKSRAVLRAVTQEEPYFMGALDEVLEQGTPVSIETDALLRTAHHYFEEYCKMSGRISGETMQSVLEIEDPGQLADIIAANVLSKIEDRQQVLEEFDELARIDSESFGDREMADRLKEKLAELGIQAKEDDTAEKIGGNAGNLFGTLKGGLSGTPILLSGHMDTVAPGIGKKPVFHEDGTITSDGTTVLGADDLTGVIAILEGIRAAQEAGIPHRDIEILFAAAEEPFTRGSSEFDFSQMKAKESYVLDVTGPVGTAILQAPTILSFEAAVKGRAAHAGFEPEKGIHAIQTAARAIAALKLGHVDEETTLNVGLISGGSVVNAVPELCTCRGEIRSYSHEKAMETLEDVRAVFETAVKEAGAELSFTHRLHVKAFHLEPVAPVAVHFAGACRTLGIEPKFGSTFGGSDGNTMMQHGIPCAVLSCGMYDVHSVREYAKVGDIVNGARLIAELITQGQEASIE